MDSTWQLKNSVFQRIFEANQRAVFSFFIGHGVDRDDAVDLLQDTFTRAWARIEKLEPMEADHQRHWLFRVAKNVLTDFGRRRVVQAKADKFLQRNASETTTRSLSRSSELQALIEAIQRLPEEQRLILSLTVLGEMTSETIGEQLEKPAGTIRYELHQAREKLKKIMQDWKEEK